MEKPTWRPRWLTLAELAALLFCVEGGCSWPGGLAEYEFCCAGVQGPTGVLRCWDGRNFTFDKCCPRFLPGWQLGSYAGEYLMPTSWFSKNVYWNMSTYLKYILIGTLPLYQKDGFWLMPLTTGLSRLNHALAQLYSCTLERLLSRDTCAFVGDRKRLVSQLRSLSLAFRTDVSQALRYLAKCTALARRSAMDNTSVLERALAVVTETEDWMRRIYDIAGRLKHGVSVDMLGVALGKACEWLTRASVLAGYGLHAQAWFGYRRLGAARVRRAVFREDLGFTRMEVLSALLRSLEEPLHLRGNRTRRELKRTLYMAEIGVMMGATAQHLLEEHPQLQWLGLDTYEGMWARNRATALEVLRPHGPRAQLWNVRSEAVTDEEVPRNSLDLLFVDGDHSEEQVLLDLRAWAPRVRSGGVVAGHDYHDSNYLGVTSAVHQFLPRGVQLEVAPDHVFFWRVP